MVSVRRREPPCQDRPPQILTRGRAGHKQGAIDTPGRARPRSLLRFVGACSTAHGAGAFLAFFAFGPAAALHFGGGAAAAHFGLHLLDKSSADWDLLMTDNIYKLVRARSG